MDEVRGDKAIKSESFLVFSANNELLAPETLGAAVLTTTETKNEPGVVTQLRHGERMLLFFRNRGVHTAPVFMFYGMANGIMSPILTELIKNRVCEVALNYSTNTCANLSASGDTEGNQVQSATTDYLLYNSIIGSIPSVIFSLFMGSWSDRYGRKIPMLLPFAGMILSSIILMICANVKSHPGYILFSPAVGSVLGGWVITSMALFSYIGDYTFEKIRALVMGFVAGALAIGVSIGQVVGTTLLKNYGFAAPVYLQFALYHLAIGHIIFFVKDHENFAEKKGICRLAQAGRVFEIQRVRDNWRTLRQKRERDGRCNIILLLLSYLVACICIENESSLLQLFSEYKPLSWSVNEYAAYASVQGIVGCVTLTVTIPVFKSIFRMKDTMMGIICSLSGIACAYFYAISVKGWMMYLGMTFGALRGLIGICMQSTMIGLVERDETAKVMSMVASVQSISSVLSAVILLNLYKATFALWPGLVFAVEAFVLLIPVATFCFVDLAQRKL